MGLLSLALAMIDDCMNLVNQMNSFSLCVIGVRVVLHGVNTCDASERGFFDGLP